MSCLDKALRSLVWPYLALFLADLYYEMLVSAVASSNNQEVITPTCAAEYSASMWVPLAFVLAQANAALGSILCSGVSGLAIASGTVTALASDSSVSWGFFTDVWSHQREFVLLNYGASLLTKIICRYFRSDSKSLSSLFHLRLGTLSLTINVHEK